MTYPELTREGLKAHVLEVEAMVQRQILAWQKELAEMIAEYELEETMTDNYCKRDLKCEHCDGLINNEGCAACKGTGWQCAGGELMFYGTWGYHGTKEVHRRSSCRACELEVQNA